MGLQVDRIAAAIWTCDGHRGSLRTTMAPTPKTVAEYPKLVAAWHRKRNAPLTPRDVLKSSRQPVWWRCNEGVDHEWQAPPRRKDQAGCPFCAGVRIAPSTSLRAKHPDIASQWHPTKNGRLSPEAAASTSLQIVWWKCPVGPDHEWRSRIRSRASGESGCPFCSGNRASASYNLAVVHPEVAARWHPTKNGKLKPQDVTPRSDRVVWWRCPHDHRHTWQAKVANVGDVRIGRATGCPYCAGKRVSPERAVFTAFPRLRRYFDKQRNGELDPAQLGSQSAQWLWWRCPRGADHSWQEPISEITHKRQPCPFCNNRRASTTNSVASIEPELAQQWHPTNNEFGAEEVVVTSHYKAWWRCESGPDHVWQAVVADRVSKRTRCPFCANRKWSITNNLQVVAPAVAEQWHPTRNASRQPLDVLCGSSERVWWRCDHGHVWRAAVRERVKGSGCPRCFGRKPVPAA